MALTVTRSFNQMVTDTTQVRDVSEQMVLLEPDASPLFVLTNAAKRKQPTVAPRFEWVEDNEVALWSAQSSATDSSSVLTNILVADGTLFGVGDIVAVPKSISSNAAPEVILVTAIATNTLTITRGVGSSGADTISATGSLKILASAFKEDDNIGAQRYTSKTVQISYAQIFKTPVKVTHTAASTKQYGAPQGERKYQLVKALIRHRSEIEAAGLWSRASETLSISEFALDYDGMVAAYCDEQDGRLDYIDPDRVQHVLRDRVPLGREAETVLVLGQDSCRAELLLAEQTADSRWGHGIWSQDQPILSGIGRVHAGQRLPPVHGRNRLSVRHQQLLRARLLD